MAGFARDVTVQANPAFVQKVASRIRHDPGIYRSARRLMAQDAQMIVDEGKKIAEGELHRRSSSRRTRSSLAHGAEYHDSFAYDARGSDVESLKMRVGNGHPAAAIIEFGSSAHDIYAKSNMRLGMVFPFDGIHGRTSGVNQLSQAAIDWMDSETFLEAFHVSHPGTNAHRILRRAAERYRDRTARSRKLTRG